MLLPLCCQVYQSLRTGIDHRLQTKPFCQSNVPLKLTDTNQGYISVWLSVTLTVSLADPKIYLNPLLTQRYLWTPGWPKDISESLADPKISLNPWLNQRYLRIPCWPKDISEPLAEPKISLNSLPTQRYLWTPCWTKDIIEPLADPNISLNPLPTQRYLWTPHWPKDISEPHTGLWIYLIQYPPAVCQCCFLRQVTGQLSSSWHGTPLPSQPLSAPATPDYQTTETLGWGVTHRVYHHKTCSRLPQITGVWDKRQLEMVSWIKYWELDGKQSRRGLKYPSQRLASLKKHICSPTFVVFNKYICVIFEWKMTVS